MSIILRESDIDNEFRKIDNCYYTLQKLFDDKYSLEKSWQLYLRVFREQFKLTQEDKIELRPSKEMTSNSIRGVDDPEAALRYKSKKNTWVMLVMLPRQPTRRTNLT